MLMAMALHSKRMELKRLAMTDMTGTDPINAKESEGSVACLIIGLSLAQANNKFVMTNKGPTADRGS